MTTFDPEQVRLQLRGPVGIDYYRPKQLQEVANDRSLSGTSDGILITGIRCILVGFDTDARELLRKAKQWLEHAIEAEEQPRHYFRYGTEATRHENLALCNWLLDDLDDRDNLDAGINFGALYNAEYPTSKEAAAIELPVYVDARRYDEALALYERHWGANKPSRPKSVKSEAAMAYIIAATNSRGEFSDEDVQVAADGFLRRNIPEFLERGGYPYLARWLKIVHWNDRPVRSRAFETVRRCSDYLPNVERPPSLG
jgi:hypothetical protein